LADMMSSEADSAGHTGAGGACGEPDPVGDWRKTKLGFPKRNWRTGMLWSWRKVRLGNWGSRCRWAAETIGTSSS
jgi:hypothetical protein